MTEREQAAVEALAEAVNAVVPPSRLPFRVKSAKGLPKPSSQFERTCRTCGASFFGLAAGRTGEAGLWDSTQGMAWFCSIECAPQRVRDKARSRVGVEREDEQR